MAGGRASKRQVWFALGLVYLIWGSTYLGIRLVVDEAPPLVSMGLRFVLAAAIMGLFLAVRGGVRQFRLTRGEALGVAFLGLLLLAVGNGMTALGQLQGVPSGVTALLIAIVPVWVAVYRTIAGDRPSALSTLGIVMGLVGLAILVLRNRGGGVLPLLGVVVILISSVSWSFGSWIQPRIWLPRNVFVSSAYQMLTAGTVLGLAGVLSGEDLHANLGPQAWGALAYLVVVGSVIGFTAYAWLLDHAPISLVATHTYVNPVVAVFLGWLVRSEPVTSPVLIGGGVVVASVILIVSGERHGARQSLAVSRVRERVPTAPPPIGG
ncbi:membrane protein [Intrasporangium chromatireducens Q5-1]|uniref:Membrane protein n=1 Tax=Intrasporangium chromatireducens Q5-1 TaxID=584657 RepID=W9GVA3_9MICO|nr:EamA family transporter [Intrasporangium chromatireducens]EWT07804.1 membrane protein [Intrasporangium chromatireducens Q5-1]